MNSISGKEKKPPSYKMKKSVLILDCGATNVKACLVDESGSVVSVHTQPNETATDPYFKDGKIWDIQSIWNKLNICIQKVRSDANKTEIAGITVTSFGVDGAFLNRNGEISYPVISWQCSRTRDVEKHLDRYFDCEWLYDKTGLQSYHFNTINKLIWLLQNKPEVFEDGAQFVMLPSLILKYLCGELATDMTMAGTTMLTELRQRHLSSSILKKLGLKINLFPSLVEPGSVIGKLSDNAAELLGLNIGIPVIASGHDTQFALIGSGAGINEPVLSSGTWEILMTRSVVDSIKMPDRKDGITIELDVIPGIADIGVQWVASGVTEWLGRLLYSEITDSAIRYNTMISEASAITAGAEGTIMIPEIFPGGFSGKKGIIEGFNIDTSRGHLYRASLESLCFYTRFAVDILKNTGNFKPDKVICVGGGSKNLLWNRMRASILGIPVHVPHITEATAIGAARVAFTGLGFFRDLKESSAMLTHKVTEFLPGNDTDIYDQLYKKYSEKIFEC